MDQKQIKFADTEIEEYRFHQYKSPILINDIDINTIVVSNRFLFGKQGFKYFIGYKDDKEFRPLCMLFPQMNTCKIYSEITKGVYFMIKDEKNFDKYIKIWEKVSHIIK